MSPASSILRPAARGRRRSYALIAAVAVLLAGCSSTGVAGYTDAGEQAGYVSGDGSVTTWDPARRPGPITLQGTAFSGETIDVAAWRGDVVLINTWYAECPPCRAEAPDLTAIVNEYAPSGLHAVGVNGVNDAGTVTAFERRFSTPYTSIQDADATAVAALQGVVPLQAVPTTVLLDRQGRVAARVIGQIDASTLRTLIDELLGATDQRE